MILQRCQACGVKGFWGPDPAATIPTIPSPEFEALHFVVSDLGRFRVKSFREVAGSCVI